MNFKINNINFVAKYEVFGKKNSRETDLLYNNAIKKLIDQRQAAVAGQKYLETDEIQSKISQLPEDTFVRFHTGVLENETEGKEQIMNFTPAIRFETISRKDREGLKSHVGDEYDTLKISFDSKGNLEKAKINSWFDKIIEYYDNKN